LQKPISYPLENQIAHSQTASNTHSSNHKEISPPTIH